MRQQFPLGTRFWRDLTSFCRCGLRPGPAPPGRVATRFTACGDTVAFVASDGRGNERLRCRAADGPIVRIGAPLEHRPR